MIRTIIRIDEEKCNGCGICAAACHEGAIDMVNGKAKLAREHFCDGFGDCLPGCPTGAITFEEREAPAYDDAAVKAAQANKQADGCAHSGCPGSRFMKLEVHPAKESERESVSQLNQWPCQIRLLPVQAPFYEGAKLLIAADCAAYAYAGFHQRFMKGKITMIGCPKLDETEYAEKLGAIIAQNNIQSVTIVRMEVPCCKGLENAVKEAIQNSRKFLPWQVVTLSRDGKILDE